MNINFDTTHAEGITILKIAQRAHKMYGGRVTDWAMDVTAVHANGCSLDLDRLLAANDFNFSHDVAGIADNLDRKAGRLSGGFIPRFATSA